VAGRRTGLHRDHRGENPTGEGDRVMSRRVGARKQAAKPAHLQPMVHRPPTEPQIKELRSCDDPVLTRSKRGNRLVVSGFATNVDLPTQEVG
jgi:hypothetical protein